MEAVDVAQRRIAIAEESGRITLTVRQAEDAHEEARDAVAGFSLGAALPPKRAIAWTAVVLILILFLALPIVTHLARAPAKPEKMRSKARIRSSSSRGSKGFGR